MKRISVTLVGVALFALVQPAMAIPIVAISLDGSVDASDITCGDGSAAPAGVICVSGGTSTTLVYNEFLAGSKFGSFGNVVLTAVDASTDYVVELDQNSIEASGAAGDLYLFSTEEFDFGLGDPSHLYGAIGGTTDGAVSYDVFVGTSAFDLATNLLSMVFAPGGADAPFSAAQGGTATLLGSQWLTQVVHVSHTVAGNSSSNAIVKVSEPGTLALLAAGLLVGGLLRRKTA